MCGTSFDTELQRNVAKLIPCIFNQPLPAVQRGTDSIFEHQLNAFKRELLAVCLHEVKSSLQSKRTYRDYWYQQEQTS
jgi:hypothetical protein